MVAIPNPKRLEDDNRRGGMPPGPIDPPLQDWRFIVTQAAVGAGIGIGAGMLATTVPWGLAGAGAVGFLGGAIGGGLTAWWRGENASDILGSAIRTGLISGLTAMAGGALTTLYASAAGAEQVLAWTAVGAGVGASTGYLVPTLPTSRLGDKFEFETTLPTARVGLGKTVSSVFGPPGRNNPLITMDIEEFPGHLPALEYPWMKSTMPPYPPRFYISDHTESLLVVDGSRFFVGCFKSFNQDAGQSSQLVPENIPPVHVLSDSDLADTSAVAQEYLSKERALANSSRLWIKADHDVKNYLLDHVNDQIINIAKDQPNIAISYCSQQARVVPISALMHYAKDLHCMEYMDKAIAGCQQTLQQAIKQANKNAGKIAAADPRSQAPTAKPAAVPPSPAAVPPSPAAVPPSPAAVPPSPAAVRSSDGPAEPGLPPAGLSRLPATGVASATPAPSMPLPQSMAGSTSMAGSNGRQPVRPTPVAAASTPWAIPGSAHASVPAAPRNTAGSVDALRRKTSPDLAANLQEKASAGNPFVGAGSSAPSV